MNFQIDKTNKGEYYFRIVANNGKILAHSEGYINLNDCEHAIELIRKNASNSLVKKVY
ncbi:YegP family protein [Exiguobacterium aurantiacum]|uniref:YegP family protein n=1 Tax=Exiguobacterium aurantiacum TaxID=33987 RepID=UPI00350E375B